MSGISARGRGELAGVLGDGRRFVRPNDVMLALDIDSGTAAKKLARWAEQGWVRRVRRGLYIGVPVDAPNPASWSEDALVVAAEVFSPCYFTGWTAARHWSLTEQVFHTTVLKTSGRVRATSERLLDHDYLLSHVAPESMWWGTKTEWRGSIRLRFADPARTVVETLDAPGIGGGIRHSAEILTAYLDEYDAAALLDAAEKLGNRAVFKRLGYLVDMLGLDQSELVEACKDRLSSGISPLDPDGPSGGRRIMRWGLRVNVNVVSEGPS